MANNQSDDGYRFSDWVMGSIVEAKPFRWEDLTPEQRAEINFIQHVNKKILELPPPPSRPQRLWRQISRAMQAYLKQCDTQ